MMKNEKFTLKAFFILKINELFNFKIYDVKTWERNNCNAHIAHYLEK